MMAKAAVLSKAVVLLLLTYCLMYFPLFVRVLCLFLFCYAKLCVHFSFAIILKRNRKLVALLLLSWRCNFLYCYYKCSVALPNVAWVGLQYTHLLFGTVSNSSSQGQFHPSRVDYA